MLVFIYLIELSEQSIRTQILPLELYYNGLY